MGALLQNLKDSGMFEDTIVLFVVSLVVLRASRLVLQDETITMGISMDCRRWRKGGQRYGSTDDFDTRQ